MEPANHPDLNSLGPHGKEEKLPASKLTAAQYLVALVLVILVTGLWRLQVLGANNFRALAQANRIRNVPILAPRGRLYDRNGKLIVDNYPSVSCYLVREQVKNLDADLPLIARGLHIPIEQIQATIRKYQGTARYQPIPLKEDITPDEQAFIAAHRDELPELETLDEQRRLYPSDGFLAHVIGYVGEVSEQMLDDPRYAFYSPGDVVGRSGIEESYDALLRGTDGSREIIVNSHGKEIGQLGTIPAVPGKDLKLTIDLDVQMAAEKAMEDKTGAIVALDPHTGEVLAMVSRPTFDPNQFSVRLSKSYWDQIVNNPDHPLLNKAIQAQLAPGSTFKTIMTLAGLQEGIAQTMHVFCAGGATFYGHFYACDAHHGLLGIEKALPESCDTFFYTLANRLGIDTIAKYGHEVGLGEPTGIDLPGEAAGTMPSTEWKLKTQHAPWYAGETISVGIGQGAVTVTPIQLARAYAGIASGGVFHRPHLVFPSEVPPQQLEAIHETFDGSGEKTISMTKQNWEIITDALAETTQMGTAAASHLEGIDFAGKTGTAQVMSHAALARSGGGHKTIPNAWFVGFAPRRNPDIVVVVLWQNGNWGANSAKLAARVIETYVNKQRKLADNVVTPPPAPETISAPAPTKTPGKMPAAE